MENKNPFKEGTTSWQDYEVMKDLQWHCTRHELKSAQAKTWQIWRQQGLDLAKDEKDNFYKSMFCKHCQTKTVHRKLNSLSIAEDTSIRANMPAKLAEKIKKHYKNMEAFLLRELPSKELEIDHKFPQIRWAGDEPENSPEMNVAEIEKRFILLNRSNNLLKSRACEKCVETKKRGCFPGLKFWYQGTENWDSNISENDEKGCVGCFWYNPNEWRSELQKLIDENKNSQKI